MKKIKLSKEEKQQHRAEDRAWKEMIQRANKKAALIEVTDWQPKPVQHEA